VGGNSRYADYYDRRSNARHRGQLVREHGPFQKLTKAEVNIDHEPVTRPPRPVPVTVWVRFGPWPAKVSAEVTAWTRDAVEIVFRVDEADERGWVWASAVCDRSPAVPQRRR
jgi:hypothetical protein